MDPLPPLNPLKAFEAAGRLMSVSKAAEELFVTPAAVSRQIRALEHFLGAQLFARQHGRIDLTPAGARYLADVAPLLASLRQSTNAIMGGSHRRHTLKIRSPATFAVRWLIPRLASFHRQHADIDVQLTTSPTPLDFTREDIDAGVELGHGQWPDVDAQPLIRNELVPVIAGRWTGPPKRLTRPRQLARATLLHSMARIDDWGHWLKAAGADEVNPYRGMKYETSLLAYQAAIEGHGVAIAQRALITRELELGTLVCPFDTVLDRGDYTYYFLAPARREQSGALDAFRHWLGSIVEDRPRSPSSNDDGTARAFTRSQQKRR